MRAQKIQDRQFFIDHIGKLIYRDKTFCDCDTCVYASKNGIKIIDESHANNLYAVGEEMGISYFETPKVR